jgi:uncharacterized protein
LAGTAIVRLKKYICAIIMVLTVEHIKRKAQQFFKDKPVKKAYLFGSYATGLANDKSDIDLIVEIDDSKKRLSLFEFVGLSTGLEKIFEKKVDLIEEHLMYTSFKEKALKEKIELYSA